MSLTYKQASKLKCLALLDLAKTDEVAAGEIHLRAQQWNTCAIGEQAAKLGVASSTLYLADPLRTRRNSFSETRLEQLGMRFMHQINKRHYGRAKRTYHAIANRVNKLFGTPAKRKALWEED